MSVEQLVEQSVDASLARGWEMTSEKGRREIVGNIIVSLGESERDKFGGVSVDLIPQVRNFEDLPVSLQGFLTLAYTPDGWDYRIVRRFVKLCQNVSTYPSETPGPIF